MLKPYIILPWVLSASTWISLAQQQPCQPRFPYTIPPPPGVSNIPKQIDGLWYKYRQMNQFNGATGVINDRVQWTVVTETIDTLTNVPAVTLHAQFARILMPKNKTCQYHFWTGYYTEDGRHFGYVMASETGFSGLKPGNGQILYHEYDKVMIEYACSGPKPDGTCGTPTIAVQTRIRPAELPMQEKESIDKILTELFAPYCITLDNLPQQPYTDDLPVCPFVDPPQCSAADIRGLAYLSTRPTGDSSRTYGTSLRCQLPNSILTQVPYAPLQAAGLWYGYRYKAIETSVTNMQYSWTNVNQGVLDMTNISAQALWMEYAFVNGSGCQHGYYVGMMGVNGQADGVLGPVSQAGDRVILKLNVLHFDGNFAVYYGCTVPDLASSTCRIPFVLAGTRTNPSQISATDKDRFDATIETLFGKYGCSTADIPLVSQTGDSVCPFQRGTACVKLHIRGLEPSPTTASTTTTVKPLNYQL